ncbi:MAG: hypothetical protein HMLKMBBP_03767 [Planctomycetes bacterium]|nr:hypothetical protein [Planctomycetota bacterium]
MHDAGCPFCEIASGAADPGLVVSRGRSVVVVPALKQRIRNRPHVLVIPAMHVERVADLDRAALVEMFATASRVAAAVRAVSGAIGTMTFHNESVPGQTLHHLHVHVVPRSAGDGFRMPDPESEVLTHESRREQAAALRALLSQPV